MNRDILTSDNNGLTGDDQVDALYMAVKRLNKGFKIYATPIPSPLNISWIDEDFRKRVREKISKDLKEYLDEYTGKT